MAKNSRLLDAAYSIFLISTFPSSSRENISRCLDANWISPDDPWVAAALGCVNDADIPDIALEMFLADCKEGLYDLHNPEPLATP